MAAFQLLLVSFDFMSHSLLSVLGCCAVQWMDYYTLAMGRVWVDCMCVWEKRMIECFHVCASLHLITDSFQLCLSHVRADVSWPKTVFDCWFLNSSKSDYIKLVCWKAFFNLFLFLFIYFLTLYLGLWTELSKIPQPYHWFD